ncbi:MAG: Glu-tRNA(Gln) amidotransferase subunit GatE, partial [Nanoarchaeota archaeon]
MDDDYSKLGLKCGLEIHQQLDTKKLFCNCPSLLRQDNPDFTIHRKLHAVAGETGEIDAAVMHQVSLDKRFIYEGYKTTCLVELDEEPPHQINTEALKIVLQIAILLNAKIFPISQIMRKTVADGSNTSGFQRTVLIARDGFLETKYGRVGIESICLEEDSARIIGATEREVFYRLDRLGIPLVEIATKPDIRNPNQAREVALQIGKILRSCNVKRGIGTIRQDVNVSIKKGARIEIKGVQKPELIEKSVELEALRQFQIINREEKVNSEVRKVLLNGETEFLRPMPGAARMYPETDLLLLKISRGLLNEFKKDLPKLIEESEEELKKKGLTNELIKLVLDGYLNDFEGLLKIYPKDPPLVAKMLTLWRNELATKLGEDISVIENVIDMDTLGKLLMEVKKGNLDKNLIRPLFNDLMKDILLEDALKKEKFDENQIEEKILKIIKNKPGLSENAYMGLVMKEFKGKINGKEAMEIIK